MSPRPLSPPLLSLAWALLAASAARADVFELAEGGRVEGTWLNPASVEPPEYHVRTASGVRVLLPAARVRRVTRVSAAAAEYQLLAPAAANTADAQWRLAEWCRRQGLTREREAHLRRVLELEPGRVDARQALGQGKIDGEWLTPDEWRQRQGYARFEGRWLLPQDVMLIQERRAVESAQRRWRAQLQTWREALASPRGARAAEEIRAIRDPHAVAALAELPRRDGSRPFKLLCVEALGGIDHPDATQALLETSLADPDDEVFFACVEQLAPRKTPALVKTYARTLADADNGRVNRAARALGELGDRAAAPALIRALHTTHVVVLQPPRGKGDPVSTTFSSAGGGLENFQLSTGGSGQAVTRRVANLAVHAALVKLTGANLGFEQQAWENWLATENRRQDARSARREP